MVPLKWRLPLECSLSLQTTSSVPLPLIAAEQTMSAVIPPGFLTTLTSWQTLERFSGTMAPYLSIISWVRQACQVRGGCTSGVGETVVVASVTSYNPGFLSWAVAARVGAMKQPKRRLYLMACIRTPRDRTKCDNPDLALTSQ